MSILTSPFLSLALLDTALRAATGEERVRLLAAKVALLQAEAGSGSGSGPGTGRSGSARSGSARATGGETAVPPSAPAAASSSIAATVTASSSATATAKASTSPPAPTVEAARAARTPVAHIPLLTARLELAHAYAPREPHAAAAEAMAVEGECRRLIKWVERGRAGRAGGGSGLVVGPRGGSGQAVGVFGGTGQSEAEGAKTDDDDDGGVPASGVGGSQPGVEDGAGDGTHTDADDLDVPGERQCQPARDDARHDAAGDQTRERATTPAPAATAPAPPEWLAEVTRLRVEALALLVRVEEDLGRPARAERWRRMV